MTQAASSGFPATLTIDLGAIARNWRKLADMSGGQCAAVVKADAYGLGMDRVAPALAVAGCDSFFVAFLDEAIALRDCLGSGPRIFVLCAAVADDPGLYAAHDLVPVVSTDDHFETWSVSGVLTDLPFLAQVETGMHRLGVTPGQAHDMLDQPTCLGVMSHLACSDEPDHPLNARQLLEFQKVVDSAPKLPRRPVLSLANSGGILLGRDYHFSLTRPGIALYGGNPAPGRANPMENVVTLECPIMQLARVPSGQSVGYGATYVCETERRIATLAVGYADGVIRHLSNAGEAVIGGHIVPYAGRVSMDLLALDVTGVPDKLLRSNPVQLIGPDMPVDRVADAAGTISYELLTRLGRRSTRRYIGG